MRYKLTLEYEGTRYSGWQFQKDARTIQGELYAAIRKAIGVAEFDLQGSGRTDAGVHALRQVAHLEAATNMELHRLRIGINDELPPDIHILSIEKMPRGFHARHDAVARSYLYQVSTRRSAFGKKLVWWVKDPLDLKTMRQAAGFFAGMHDFRSFAAKDAETESTRVRLEDVLIVESGDLILFRIVGSHFLWKMVRQMIGVLVEVGRGKLKPSDVNDMLIRKSDLPAQLTAPPSGLFLERVYYKGDPKLDSLHPVLNIG